jgi:hypothetical protein
MAADTDTPTTTLLERMVASGISEDRARAWIAAGSVKVAGRHTTDPATPVPDGTRWLIHP